MDRSENMRRIRGINSAPELAVRRRLRALGFRGYRLHRKDLPGKPDIAYVGKKKAVEVYGCFWHGHDCPEGVRKPKSNTSYWLPKITGNRQRDVKNLAALKAMGWRILVIWECELTNDASLDRRLRIFMCEQ